MENTSLTMEFLELVLLPQSLIVKKKARTIACLKISSYEVILEILFKNNQVERNTINKAWLLRTISLKVAVVRLKLTKSVTMVMRKIWWVKETTSFFEGFVKAQLSILNGFCYM